MFDPRKCGAKCDECPLGPGEAGVLRTSPWEPVGPTHRKTRKALVVGAPSRADAANGYLISGHDGTELSAALADVGAHRTDYAVLSVTACVPANGKPEDEGSAKRMAARLALLNKQRAREELPPLLSPAEACRPMFLEEAAKYAHFVVFDKASMTALSGLERPMDKSAGDRIGLTKDWRHTYEEDAPRRMVPTVSLGMARMKPQYAPVLRAHLAKAERWFSDRLNWVEPELLSNPTPDELREWLRFKAPFHIYDLETDGLIPETTKIRCIALATPDLGPGGRLWRPGMELVQVARSVGITLLGEGDLPFMAPDVEAEIIGILSEALRNEDRSRRIGGHNRIKFDDEVILNRWGVVVSGGFDTLFGARFSNPDLPKGLKTLGVTRTDVGRWDSSEKGESNATGKVSPEERLRYCQYDTVVNARIAPPLIKEAEEAGAFRPIDERLKPHCWPADVPFNLWNVDHRRQERAVRMHRRGIYVWEEERKRLHTHFTQLYRELEVKIGQTMAKVGDRFSNPNSYDEVRDLLYSRKGWNLGIPAGMEAKAFYTEAGLPGTGDVVLRAWLATAGLEEQQYRFIWDLRLYRRFRNKIVGTLLAPLHPSRKPETLLALLPQGQLSKDELEELVGEGGKLQDVSDTFVWWDGRVRPSWSAHITSVGRYSCSRPNLQNIGRKKGQGELKRIFRAGPGCILIGADLNQAHLYIAACYWKIQPIIDCILRGDDVHGAFAFALLGKEYSEATGWGVHGFDPRRKPDGGMAGALRDMVKTFKYAWIYWASVLTILTVMQSTEGDPPDEHELKALFVLKNIKRDPLVSDFVAASMPYINKTAKELHLMNRLAHKAEPQWREAWEWMLSLYHLNGGWLEEPIFKRRSGVLEGGKPQAVVNFPILAAEQSAMTIAEERIEDLFPPEITPTGEEAQGLIHQGHDSLATEVPLPRGYTEADHWAWVKAAKAAKKAGEKPPPLHPELEEKRVAFEGAMKVTVPGWATDITGEAGVGITLKDV